MSLLFSHEFGGGGRRGWVEVAMAREVYFIAAVGVLDLGLVGCVEGWCGGEG